MRRRDLTGFTTGCLTVTAPDGSAQDGRRWICVCVCGGAASIDRSNLTSGRAYSCGCIKRPYRRRGAPLALRFWRHVDQSGGPEACWPWTGATRTRNGYGRHNDGGKFRLAHRLAFALHNQVDVDGLVEGQQVCHRCDNPPCCNPSHLWLGTALENSRDCILKGRARWPGRKTYPRGEQAPNATTTDAQAHAIFLRCVSTRMPLSSIAEQFQVSRRLVRDIYYGRKWKHVRENAPPGAAGPRRFSNGQTAQQTVWWQGQERLLSQVAAEVGLDCRTLQWRLRAGWPTEKAIMTPPDPRKRNRLARVQ